MIYILATVIILYLNVAQSEEYIRTKRRMYAMCPPSFERIGSDCYYVSKVASSWLDGHFNCKDKNSKLAEPEKVADRKLRQFLLKHDNPIEGEIWIGGSFDRINKIWQWGYTGVNITHNSFSKLDPCQSLDFQCIVLNPNLKYRWSARSCVERHRYVCQHKMPKVSEKNRFKVYNRWNQTYPNQYANEIVLEVINNPNSGSRQTSFVRPIGSNETLSIRTRHKKSKNYPSAALPQAVQIFLSPSTQKPQQQSQITSNLSNDINSTKNVTSQGDSNYGQLIVTEKSREQIMREKAIRRRQRLNQTNRAQQIKDNDTVDKITSFDLAMARKRNAERRLLLRQQKKLKREQLKQEKLAEQKRLAEIEASKKRAQEEEAEIERQKDIAMRKADNEKQELLAKQEHEEKIRRHEEHRQRILEQEKIRLENENRRKSDAMKGEEERTQKLEEERQRSQQEEFERYEREEIARRDKERARLEAKQKQDDEIKRLAEQERQNQEEQNRLDMAERRRQEEEEQLKMNERKLKEEEDRIKRERDEEKRRIKALRREKNDLELQKQLNERKKEKTRRLQIRLSKLSESDRLAFLEHLREKRKPSDNTNNNFANEATIPE